MATLILIPASGPEIDKRNPNQTQKNKRDPSAQVFMYACQPRKPSKGQKRGNSDSFPIRLRWGMVQQEKRQEPFRLSDRSSSLLLLGCLGLGLLEKGQRRGVVERQGEAGEKRGGEGAGRRPSKIIQVGQ